MSAPRRSYATSVADIAQMLAARIQDLAPQLLPGGKRDGAEWRAGSVNGEPGNSLAVHLTGAKAGTWADFAAAPPPGMPQHRACMGGDALDLVAWCRCGGDKTQAIKWARSWLGLPGADAEAHRKAPPAPPVKLEKMPSEKDDEGKRLSAIRLWLEGAESIAGTPAADYLAGRGLHLAELRRIPRALRFHAEVWNAEAQRRMPAMLAAITNAEGAHIATHRTYLEPGGPTGWRKAAGLRNAKKVLGSYAGGAIRLWRGASGRPMAEAPTGDVLAVAEGIEDALTVALACPEWRVIAAVAVNNFANLVLPAQLMDVFLICDRDGENAKANMQRERAMRRWLEEGRSVREARPPEGFKDFNDWWQHERRQQAGGQAHG